MAIKFHVDRTQAAVRALGEVARKTEHVSITPAAGDRAWASVLSPDYSTLLEVELDEGYPRDAPALGFVARLCDVGKATPVRPWPAPWDLGIARVVDALEGCCEDVLVGEDERRELAFAVTHAVGADDPRAYLRGAWLLASGGACASDGHRLIVPRAFYDGGDDEVRAWLPAPLVRALARLRPDSVHVLLPRESSDEEAWGAAAWEGGRAAFLCDPRNLWDAPPLRHQVARPGSGFRRAGLDERGADVLSGARGQLGKSRAGDALVQVTVDGVLYVGQEGARDVYGTRSVSCEPAHVNPAYLADAIHAVGDVREVAVADPVSPVYITSGRRAVGIMPLRR